VGGRQGTKEKKTLKPDEPARTQERWRVLYGKAGQKPIKKEEKTRDQHTWPVGNGGKEKICVLGGRKKRRKNRGGSSTVKLKGRKTITENGLQAEKRTLGEGSTRGKLLQSVEGISE